MTGKEIGEEIREQQDAQKNLDQLVDKMYSEFSRSENKTYGHQHYKTARIYEHTCADTSDAAVFSYYGRGFKLTCGGPHFSDTSESSDFAGLSVYDGNVRLDLERYARYFAGYSSLGSIPSPIKILSMKNLGERKYEVVAQIGSCENVTYMTDFEKRKVEKIEGKEGGENGR